MPDALVMMHTLDGSRSRTGLRRAFGRESIDERLETMVNWEFWGTDEPGPCVQSPCMALDSLQ
jgi:hypothetical protein